MGVRFAGHGCPRRTWVSIPADMGVRWRGSLRRFCREAVDREAVLPQPGAHPADVAFAALQQPGNLPANRQVVIPEAYQQVIDQLVGNLQFRMLQDGVIPALQRG